MNYKYYKVLNASMTRCGYQYMPGLNDLSGYPDEYGGHLVCYFTDISHILQYARYGPLVCGIKPKSEEVYAPEVLYQEEGEVPGWYADKVWLSRPKDLWTVETFEFFIERRAIINFGDYDIFKVASTRNTDVFHYLMECAMEAGFYDVVKSALEFDGFM